MKNIKLLIFFLLMPAMAYSQSKTNCHQFPIPEKTEKRLFYLQRNLNANTIVYDANFDAEGNLDSSDPVRVYWIRYEEKGRTMPLRTIEKKLAFGVKHERADKKHYDFKVTLNAFNKRHIYLRQDAPFKVTAYTIINGTEVALDHIYVQAVEGRYLSKVDYIDLFGEGHCTNQQKHERLQL